MEGNTSLQGLKLVAVWTCSTPEKDIAGAKRIGFNGIIWNNPECVRLSHDLGMKAFKILEPLKPRAGAMLQVMLPEEADLSGGGAGKDLPGHQEGGEPAAGRREILKRELVCPQDPTVIDYAAGQVKQAIEQGYDGIVWDFIGYRNYHSCECERCKQGLDAFKSAHQELSHEAVRGVFYKSLLVNLYAKLYSRVKQEKDDVIIVTHTHPVFLPDVFHGLDIQVDYSGITAAWFFKPFQTYDKVRRYAEKIVKGPYARAGTKGMPMIGYYGDGDMAGHRKEPERLLRELEIVRDTGAQNIMICELGHILRSEQAVETVRQILAAGDK